MKPDKAWDRLGSLVVERRVDLGMETTTAFSDVTGLSTRILGDLENGRKDSYRAATLIKVERALKWAPGSIDSVLAGGRPSIDDSLHGQPASVLQSESERDASVRLELSRETAAELVEGIRYRVDELRRRVDSADKLLAELPVDTEMPLLPADTQEDYDLAADDAFGYSHEEEDELREMEP